MNAPLDLRRIEAILFDFDGTLADTDDALVTALTRALRPLNAILPERSLGRLARWAVMSAETPFNAAYALADRLDLDELLSPLLRRRSVAAKPPGLIPDVRPLLQRAAGDYSMAIVTTQPDESQVQAFVRAHDLTPYLPVVVAGNSLRRIKPHPSPILMAAERLEAAPEACLVVGDTVVDILAGRAAGAQTVGVLCGFGGRGELKRAGADLILDSTADLMGVLFPGG